MEPRIPLPNYIEQRIRRSIPDDMCVVPGSTPVVSFGNSITANVATLGLNPSKIEFLDRNGNELQGSKRRLATHRSLGVTDLGSAPREVIEEVFSDCNLYFDRNPYRKWFDQLEKILDCSNFSYYNGTACHLDLVQWATNPTWGSLKPKSAQEKLIQADLGFLKKQLSQDNIQVVLVNGSGVINELKQRIDTRLDEVEPIKGIGRFATRIYEGVILGDVRIVAWSTNIQSSYGVSNELRKELASRVSSLTEKCLTYPKDSF